MNHYGTDMKQNVMRWMQVLDTATIARVLEGGQSVCTEAGIPVAGGHSIDSVEPIYGLVVIGLVRKCGLDFPH